MQKPSIAILSDQTLFRRGLSQILRAQGFEKIAEYESREKLSAARPDVLFVDLDHEREDTLTLVRALRRQLFDTQIVVIGTALRQGAADASFDAEVETPKADVQALVAAARLDPHARRCSTEALHQRRLWSRLTPRQRDVMRWLATGADNRAIGHKLGIGERAVKAHVSALLETFGARNRTQLALLADRAGLWPPARVRA